MIFVYFNVQTVHHVSCIINTLQKWCWCNQYMYRDRKYSFVCVQFTKKYYMYYKILIIWIFGTESFLNYLNFWSWIIIQLFELLGMNHYSINWTFGTESYSIIWIIGTESLFNYLNYWNGIVQLFEFDKSIQMIF